MADQKIQSPRVSAVFNKRLREMNLTRSDFIRKFHDEYGDQAGSRNHLFKILNGQAIIGERGLLPYICKSLGLNYDEMVKLVRADKIQSKNWVQFAPKANQIQLDVITVMDTLSRKDQEEVLLFAKMKARR